MKLKLLPNLILYALVLFAISCTDPTVEMAKARVDFIEKIALDDDEQLKKIVTNLYGDEKSAISGRTLQTDFGIIKMDGILRLKDTLFNRTRYSFLIEPRTDSLLFENLIISVRQEGVFHYILQYYPDPLWLKQNLNNIDWSSFTGTVRQLDMSRSIVAEGHIANGKNLTKEIKVAGKTKECYECSWTVSNVGATFGQVIDIDCGGGGKYVAYAKTGECGGGSGGDGGGSYGGDGGGYAAGESDSGGYGSGGNYYSGGGGDSGGGTSDGGYTNPIGINVEPWVQYKLCGDVVVSVYSPCPDEPIVTWIGKDLGYPDTWWQDDLWLDANFQTDPYDQFKKLTKAEKELVKQFPQEALSIQENSKVAQQKTIEKFGGNFRNDKSDAFRHAFWQALNTKDVGTAITNAFANAHESEVPLSLALEKDMDLFNNTKGIQFGEAWASFDDNYLADSIFTLIEAGILRYLSPLDLQNLIIPGVTQLVPTNQ